MSFTVEGEPRPTPASVAVTAYRVVHEALAAVRQHSGVTEASVTVRWKPDALELEVVDDGESGSDESAFELATLSERVKLHGGTVALSSSRNGTSLVNARIPLEAQE